jgi:hypothetical protein
VFVGLPGLVLAPLLWLTVPEPARPHEPKAEGLGTAKQALGFVVEERRLWGFLFIGLATYTIASFAKVARVPTLMVRGYGISPAEAGYVYGTLGLVSGLAGFMAWPLITEYWTKRGRKVSAVPGAP